MIDDIIVALRAEFGLSLRLDTADMGQEIAASAGRKGTFIRYGKRIARIADLSAIVALLKEPRDGRQSRDEIFRFVRC